MIKKHDTDKISPATVGRNNLNISITHDPAFFRTSLMIIPSRPATAMTHCSVDLSYRLRPPETLADSDDISHTHFNN